MKKAISAVLGGHKAKAFGHMFEMMFQSSCIRHHQIATRMPDGCKQISATRMIRVRTPWDWILTKKGRTAFIDTKTCATKTFAHSKIEEHQVKEMLRHSGEGAVTGYVVWFRVSDEIVFYSADLLWPRLAKAGSLSPSHGIPLGSSRYFSPSVVFDV